jgi:alanine racemase
MSTRLEVDTKQILKNLKFVNNTILKDFKNKVAVVKGNGYGHGTEIITKLAVQGGATVLAVARIVEAEHVTAVLKSMNKKLPILCLGIIDKEEVPIALKLGVTIAVGNLEQVKQLAKLNIKGLKVH